MSEAAAVLNWAEHGHFDEDGQFAEDPGDDVYAFGHYAIGAYLLERYDVVNRTMDAIKRRMDRFGGCPFANIDGHAYTHLAQPK